MSRKVYYAAFKTSEDLQEFLEAYKKPSFIPRTSRIVRGIDPKKDRKLIEQFEGEIEEDIQMIPFAGSLNNPQRILWFLFGNAEKNERVDIFPASIYEIVYASQTTLSALLRNGTFKIIICEWQLEISETSFDTKALENLYHTIRGQSGIPIVFYIRSNTRLEIGNRFSNLKERYLVLSAHDVDEVGLRFIVQNL